MCATKMSLLAVVEGAPFLMTQYHDFCIVQTCEANTNGWIVSEQFISMQFNKLIEHQ